MRVRAAFLVIACLLVSSVGWFASGSARAQAWTRDAGSIYFQFSHRYIRASSLYGRDGNSARIAEGDYVMHVLGLYGEVGVVDRWLTLSLEGELLRSNTLKNQARVFDVGDFRAGAWTGVLVDPFRIAAGLLVGIPVGDDNPGPPGSPEEQLPTGDGEVDVHFRLALGHSFGGGKYPLLHYVLAEVGYALRTKGFNDQIVYRGELGTRIDRKGWDRMLLVLRLSGTELLGGFSDASNPLVLIGIGEFEVTAVGFEFAVRAFDPVHLSFGLEGALRAAAVPSALQYKFGISWEL